MNPKLTTFDLTWTYRNLQDLLARDEITKDDYEVILEKLEGEISEKFDSLNYVLQSFEGKEQTLLNRITELKHRKKRFQNSQKRIKELIMMLMRDEQKVETTENTFSRIKGREKIIIANKATIPSAFKKTKIQYDKKKAKKFYRDNNELPAGFEVKRGEDYIMIRSR